jgi:imidazolonepropionase
MTLLGPFHQFLTMDKLPPRGPLQDSQLEILHNVWIRKEGELISDIGPLEEIKQPKDYIQELPSPCTAIPGLIDAHTHLCFAKERSSDYALRASGKSYQEIAKEGGGILSTVKAVREATKDELVESLLQRINSHKKEGVTTIEIKTGYALSAHGELKMLHAIQEAQKMTDCSLIPTYLAAHTLPPEHKSKQEYLEEITLLLPEVKNFCKRVDIFVDETAFSVEEAKVYLENAKELGFDLTLHVDQFHPYGACLAAELKAASADHLEASTPEEWKLLKEALVSAVLLPGACMGLGLPYPNARGMLDTGLSVCIASDWNPGSAPMGKLLLQAAVLGMFAKMTLAETLAAITVRAALALRLNDRGILRKGMRADLAIYPCQNYREILYYQGSMLPIQVN